MNNSMNRVVKGDFQQSEFMQLTLGSAEMLLPQKEIKTFESVQEIDKNQPGTNSLGWISYMGDKIPVYSFDENLEVIRKNESKNAICVILNHMDIAILCDDIKVFNQIIMSRLDLPLCMSRSHTPVGSFCLYSTGDNVKLGMVYSAKSLKNYVSKTERAFVK